MARNSLPAPVTDYTNFDDLHDVPSVAPDASGAFNHGLVLGARSKWANPFFASPSATVLYFSAPH